LRTFDIFLSGLSHHPPNYVRRKTADTLGQANVRDCRAHRGVKTGVFQAKNLKNFQSIPEIEEFFLRHCSHFRRFSHPVWGKPAYRHFPIFRLLPGGSGKANGLYTGPRQKSAGTGRRSGGTNQR
jgi:hypothetical protein